MLPRRQRRLKRLNDEARCAMHGEKNTVFNPAMGECSYLQTVSRWIMNFEVTTWKVASSRLKIWQGNWRFGMQNFEVLDVCRWFGWQVSCWFNQMMIGEVQTGWTNFEAPRPIHPILDKCRTNTVNVEPIPIYFLSHWHSYVLIMFHVRAKDRNLILGRGWHLPAVWWRRSSSITAWRNGPVRYDLRWLLSYICRQRLTVFWDPLKVNIENN